MSTPYNRAEAAELTKNFRLLKVSESSRRTYLQICTRFLLWVVEHAPELATEYFLQEVSREVNLVKKRKLIHEFISNPDREKPPIKFGNLTVEHVVFWCNSNVKSDGSKLKFTSHSGFRSALKYIFDEYDAGLRKEFYIELNAIFKGIKRSIAKEQSLNNKKIQIGKDPLSFDLYGFLNEILLKQEGSDFVFAKCFLTMSWNLMCRSSNTVSIRLEHLKWHGDSFQVFFAHQKTDQFGDKPKDPRNIYSNPLMPAVCPILSLALYWSSFDVSKSEKLFPGSKQYDRFRKCLEKLLNIDEVKTELARRGLEASSFGSHSTRKGAATYASSGSTSCPSNAAIHLRASWKMPGVEDTYVRFQEAGDQFVGRTVAGLPSESSEFSVLPPHFIHRTEIVEQYMNVMFPNLPHNLSYIGEFCLASLVYHHDFILRTCHREHRIRGTPLFMSEKILKELRPLVKSGHADDNSWLKATGIPPHVSLLNKFENLMSKQSCLEETFEKSKSEIVRTLIEEIEKRALSNNVVTYNGLDSTIARVLDAKNLSGLENMLRNEFESLKKDLKKSDTIQNEIVEKDDPEINQLWSGILPDDFVFPKGSVRSLWNLWFLGNDMKKIPPLKYISEKNLPSRAHGRVLGRARALMSRYLQKANELGVEITIKTLEEASSAFNKIDDHMKLPEETSSKRKRRNGQLSWQTVARLWSEKDKRERDVNKVAMSAANKSSSTVQKQNKRKSSRFQSKITKNKRQKV